MSSVPETLEPPPYPIAIRAENIACRDTKFTVTNRPEPWHNLDYSVEHEGITLFTVQGQPWKPNQTRTFFDRSGLPLFELRCQWYDSSTLSLRLPGGTQYILEAKLRVAMNAPRAVVTFRNAIPQPSKSARESTGEVMLEVYGQDLYSVSQVVVVHNRNVAYIHRVTDRSLLAEGQRPPFRYRPKWTVHVAEGVDILLIAAVVVIIGQRAGTEMNES